MDILKAKRAEELFVEDEPGKGLSTNDYTNEDKQLVQGAVQKEGDQRIQGILTIEQSPVVPDATLPQHPMTLNQGVLKTKIKQTTGTSESDLMSQKAVTDELVQVRSDLSVTTNKLTSAITPLDFKSWSAGVIPYKFIAGKTYVIRYYSATSVKLSTRLTPDGPTIDLITPSSLAGSGEVVYTATQDSNYLRMGSKVGGFIYQTESLTEDVVELNTTLEKHIFDTLASFLSGVKTINTLYSTDENQSARMKVIGLPIKATFYTSEFSQLAQYVLVDNIWTDRVVIPKGTRSISLSTTDGIPVESNTNISFHIKSETAIETLVDKIDNGLAGFENSKVDVRYGKNLFGGIFMDSYIYNKTGGLTASTYWAISNPIDVSGHTGEKIVCNYSADTTNRYHCFEDENGNKTTALCTTNPVVIPSGAVKAYIGIYKRNTQPINEKLVQIEIGNISPYENVNKIGGYLDEYRKAEILFPPSPQVDLHSTYTGIKSANIYARLDALVTKFPTYISKVSLGMDAGGTLPIYGYKLNFTNTPLFKIVFLCNQHGGSANGDAIMGGLVSTIMAEDLCGSNHRHHDLLRWIRDNVSVNVMPCCNPWGIDNLRRVNYNGVNLNRNWDTSIWSSFPSGVGTDDYKGTSPASEVETQYMVSFINSISPDIIIDNHTLGGVDGSHDANSGIFYTGFPKMYMESKDAYHALVERYNKILKSEYGFNIHASYDVTSEHNAPDARVWADEHGLDGGLIEMNWRDPLDQDNGFTSSVIEASYMLALFVYQLYRLKYQSCL